MDELKEPITHHPAGTLPGRRLDVIALANETGLRVELLPGRCLDAGQVSLDGVPFGWIGPDGIGPARRGAMETALGGLLCTCGFDHIRQPVTAPDGRHYPLHGNMALRAARQASAAPGTGRDGRPALIATAQVRDATDPRAVYVLDRRIELALHENRLRLRDEVSLRCDGRVADIFALYHVNLGARLIGPGLEVTQGGLPRHDLAALPGVTFAEAVPEGGETIRLRRARDGQVADMALWQQGDTLAFRQYHRNPARDPALFCVEPTSHDRLPRDRLLAGHPPWTGHRTRVFSLEFAFSVSRSTP